jgi:hypothetical protein
VSFAADTKAGASTKGVGSMAGDIDSVTQMLRNTDQPLDAPIKDVKDKWRLLPAFLKMRGLTKQHIDSFNYFLNVDIKTIVMANNRISCDADPSWYLEYTDIRIGPTNVDLPDAAGVSEAITPQQCRLRDMTYSAQVLTMTAPYSRPHPTLTHTISYPGTGPALLCPALLPTLSYTHTLTPDFSRHRVYPRQARRRRRQGKGPQVQPLHWSHAHHAAVFALCAQRQDGRRDGSHGRVPDRPRRVFCGARH